MVDNWSIIWCRLGATTSCSAGPIQFARISASTARISTSATRISTSTGSFEFAQPSSSAQDGTAWVGSGGVDSVLAKEQGGGGNEVEEWGVGERRGISEHDCHQAEHQGAKAGGDWVVKSAPPRFLSHIWSLFCTMCLILNVSINIFFHRSGVSLTYIFSLFLLVLHRTPNQIAKLHFDTRVENNAFWPFSIYL